MKKTYKIDVDCANCANKMEEAANNTAGVANAVVNFMALKMSVEFEDGADTKSVMEEVLKNCKKVEDDCEIFLYLVILIGVSYEQEAKEGLNKNNNSIGVDDNFGFTAT